MSDVRREERPLQWIIAILTYLLSVHIALAQDVDLSSWNDSVARREILQLIAKIDDPKSPGYLPPQDRVAVFDIDGTLWPERPTSIAGAFYVDRIKDHLHKFREHINFKDKGVGRRPKKHEVDDDAKAFEIESVDSYKKDVRDWLTTATHPSLKMPYVKLVYAPMHQLIEFLKSKGFKVYLVTAAEADFMKAASEELFGVPPEQVVGTQVFSRLSNNGEGIVVSRTHIPRLINSRSNKVITIVDVIGKRPIIAFGNSEGDREMLGWVSSGGEYHRAFLIRHDDPTREFDYDDEISKDTNDTKVENEHTSVVVSMKKDWKRVFEGQ